MRVLLAEDSTLGASQTQLLLNSMSLVVDTSGTAEEIEEITKSDDFDLIIFTSNIVGGEITGLIDQYRTNGGIKPVIALINSTSIIDLVNTLEYGADDCMQIPFNIDEFKARVRAALRRYNTTRARDITFGPLKWNSFSNAFYLDDQLLDISPKEKLILEVFIKNPNVIITKESIADKVYSFNDHINIKTVTAHIYGIRKKITHIGISIETVKNHGYRLVTV